MVFMAKAKVIDYVGNKLKKHVAGRTAKANVKPIESKKRKAKGRK